MARQETGPQKRTLNSRATFSKDAQMRVGKQLQAARPNNEQAEWKPKQESTYPFSWGLMMGELLLMMGENQLS
jgi:hypothetical protein